MRAAGAGRLSVAATPSDAGAALAAGCGLVAMAGFVVGRATGVARLAGGEAFAGALPLAGVGRAFTGAGLALTGAGIATAALVFFVDSGEAAVLPVFLVATAFFGAAGVLVIAFWAMVFLKSASGISGYIPPCGKGEAEGRGPSRRGL